MHSPGWPTNSASNGAAVVQCRDRAVGGDHRRDQPRVFFSQYGDSFTDPEALFAGQVALVLDALFR